MAASYATRIIYFRYTPHVLMILVQTGYSFQYFLTETAFNQGLNPHVFVTYRYVASTVAIAPFAYFLERRMRPKLTSALFLEFFVLALVGVSLTFNMFFVSMKYTSSTFVTSMINTIPAITFVFAVVLRLEIVDVRTLRGITKIFGVLISLAGVLTITLYKGTEVPSLPAAPIHIKSNPVQQDWIKGSVLLVTSCVTWSIWFILQAYTVKKYPAQLSLTAWTNLLGAAQSAIFTICVHRDPSSWSIKFDAEFWSIVYSGAITCGIASFLQLWCNKQRGPVFVTVFNSISTVLVAILAYFIFGEVLKTASIIGGAIVIAGLYILLWSKENDKARSKLEELPSPNHDAENASQLKLEMPNHDAENASQLKLEMPNHDAENASQLKLEMPNHDAENASKLKLEISSGKEAI